MQSLMLLVFVAVVAGLVQGECMVETEVDNNFLVTKLVSNSCILAQSSSDPQWHHCSDDFRCMRLLLAVRLKCLEVV